MAHTSPSADRIEVPAAGPYRLDPARSTVSFHTRHLFGLAAVTGTMRVISGSVDLDPATPSGSLAVTIGATSFETGHPQRDRDVKSTRFLDVEQFPDLIFRATTLAHDSANWTLPGKLTVKGVTQPVTLDVRSVTMVGPGFQARATARIDRYAFGVTAAKGMAARYLDVELNAVAEPAV
jgi:polyisoprenoid-binding protein YceI